MPSVSLPIDFITIDELYAAYRKAKVDTFYERSQVCDADFATYERDLDANLNCLRNRLTSRRKSKKSTTTAVKPWVDDVDFIGRYAYVPKSLTPPSSKTSEFVYSDHWDRWQSLVEMEEPINAQFRPIGQFNVDMHIVCALWINLVGHKFDACLTKCSKGGRLRRILQPEDAGAFGNALGDYHRSAAGSFELYFYRYREWRDDGLRAIEQELSAGSPVVAMTMDLTRFYHRVDARFLWDPKFLEACRFEEVNGAALTKVEQRFTKQLVAAFSTWAKQVPTFDEDEPIGIPVGNSASRVIANVLLAEFDRQIVETISPVYYGRYVDDVFLVLRKTNRIKSQDDLMAFLSDAIDPLHCRSRDERGQLTLEFPYAEESKLEFGEDKQQVFMLHGEIGEDFIATIRDRVNEVSSEWRLLPELSHLGRSAAAKTLTANRSVKEDADSLRKADVLSLRRLSFASLLRQMEAASRDLPPHEWADERNRLFEFAERHVLNPINYFDFENYVPRLLSIAVECGDWAAAHQIIKTLSRLVTELQNKVAVAAAEPEKLWIGFRRHLRKSLWLAVWRSIPLNEAVNASAIRLIEEIDDLQRESEDIDELLESMLLLEPVVIACRLWSSDLAKRPFKESLLSYDERTATWLQYAREASTDVSIDKSAISESVAGLHEFLTLTGHTLADNVLIRPLLYPTRPLHPSEISDCVPDCIANIELLARLTRTLRGTHIYAQDQQAAHSGHHNSTVFIGRCESARPRKIAITSFRVEDFSWSSAANRTPDLSAERYQRFVSIANGLTTLPSGKRPDYVLFPELSIPRRWVPGLAQHFNRSGISLIAGVEYRHCAAVDHCVFNEAKMFLIDNRLGYKHECVITQQKKAPAPGERDQLRQMYGLTLASDQEQHHVYRHFGFDFGVLVCSELTDIEIRHRMRGSVDALMVLAWNRDLESFSALVESAALDVHCFIALTNNRKYGDGRVRAPYADSWRRDLVRIKGGLEDYFVITRIDTHELRQFQSAFESPEFPFKPVPDGFAISELRRVQPTVH